MYESHSDSEAAHADEMQDGRLPLSSQKAVGEGSAVSQWAETQSFCGCVSWDSLWLGRGWQGGMGVLLVGRASGTYSATGPAVAEWAAVAPGAVAMSNTTAMTEAASSRIDVRFLAHGEECMGQDGQSSQGLHRERLSSDVGREVCVGAQVAVFV